MFHRQKRCAGAAEFTMTHAVLPLIALLSCLFLLTLPKGRAHWLSALLGVLGFLAFFIILGLSISYYAALREGRMGPNGQADGGAFIWSGLLASGAATVMAFAARRKGAWKAIGWGGGTFIWTFFLAFFLYLCDWHWPGRNVSHIRYLQWSVLLGAVAAFIAALASFLLGSARARRKTS